MIGGNILHNKKVFTLLGISVHKIHIRCKKITRSKVNCACAKNVNTHSGVLVMTLTSQCGSKKKRWPGNSS